MLIKFLSFLQRDSTLPRMSVQIRDQLASSPSGMLKYYDLRLPSIRLHQHQGYLE